MNMRREKAITQLEILLEYCESMMTGEHPAPVWRWDCEALQMAICRLRPVSREQVEKVWRGCEWCNGEHSNNGEISAYAEVECEGCDAGDNCPNAHSSDDPCYGMVDRALPVNFCPVCGRPLTDEAVQMVMERLGALHSETKTD